MALCWVTALVLVSLASSECPSSTWLETSDGYCYLSLPDPPFYQRSADASLEMCKHIEETALLSEIYNERDQMMVEELTPINTWLGLRRNSLESLFYWPSGHAITYTNWGTGEPSNTTGQNCVYLDILAFAGKWGTYRCDESDALALCYTKAT